ncbi:MAG TPA: LysM peptidoglycan-binding domain-containing protein [Kofleriaceae bacterium]|nr:LysM peptidoglycan-binding domain-containing protein [Kofleriaceae bacterium]
MRRVVAAAVLVLALRGPVRAQETGTLIYKVRPNDSLSLIAAEFYGDRNKAIFIMVANKMEHPRKLRGGERLKIPVSRQLITSPGDTFESIAKALLGDERRGRYLARFNNLDEGSSLASGTELAIPFTVTHTAQSTESIANITAAYFGDAKNAALISGYNFLDKDAIDKGDRVIIPIFNVRLQASKLPALDAESRNRVQQQRRARERAAAAIPAARQAWRDGDFAGVRGALAEAESELDYLDAQQAAEAGVLLGATHVASNDNKPALVAFKRVLQRLPTYELDAFHFSPKVLAVWREAGGTVAP